MVSNLPDEQKTNWVSNEIVMPVDTNAWGESINKLTNAVPLYTACGDFYTATYSNNTYSLTPLSFSGGDTNQTVSQYVNGMRVVFICPADNLGASTVNVNSLGNKSIKTITNVDVDAGKLKQGTFIELRYDSANNCFKYIEFASGGGLEIGDIGIAPLGIDETQNKRRYLNGQVIIQDQYTSFTTKLKSAVQLYPSLACTEAQWQATVTLSVGGQCGKFVIDDVAGTIRLPKIIMPIQGLTNLANLAEIVEAGLPNIEGSFPAELRSATSTDLALGAFYNMGVTRSGGGGEGTDWATGFDASRSNSIYGNSTTVQQEQIQYPYFIQVATGVEESVDVTREIELNNPFCLLDYKYSEYKLDNISWLRSNGQWNAKSVFPDAYDLLLKIYNGTETKAGVSVKLSTETYADTDFVLNTSDETFRLPLKVALASGKAVVGNGMTIGYTTGSIDSGVVYSGSGSNLFCGYTGVYGEPTGTTYTGSTTVGANKSIGLTTDPTKSGIELSDANLYLYFYVGETVQNANLINAGRIEEKIADLITVVDTYQNGTSWYRVYSDGWCVQGGVQSNMDSSGTGQRTISLLKPFTDTNYSVQVTWTNAATQSPSTAWTGSLRSRSVDSFVINKDNKTYITEYTWQAEGYIS